MAELKTCKVAYTDTDGVRHTVDVTASTLYEAAVLGLKAFQIADWMDLPRGFLDITVSAPVVTHQVSIQKLTTWLQVVRSPQDLALKRRLKDILGWHD